MYHIDDVEVISDMHAGLHELRNKANNFLRSRHGDGELVTRGRKPSQAATDTIPARRYHNDFCLYDDNLPVNTGKQKHAYSGRFGETAEVMRKQLRVKVPIPPKPVPKESNISVDGTFEMGTGLTVIAEDLRDIEDEVRRNINENVAADEEGFEF